MVCSSVGDKPILEQQMDLLNYYVHVGIAKREHRIRSMRETAMTRLTDRQIDDALAHLEGWQRDGQTICRTFHFENYYQTIAFVNAVAWIAHRCDHHPDLAVYYSRCLCTYSTHAVGGITERDVECARSVNALFSADPKETPT
jgi:4a-hydroxytetrahydrobiopterin dehydratase